MSNRGIPPVLRIARERVRRALIDVRWYLIVLINRRIDQWSCNWHEKNKDRA